MALSYTRCSTIMGRTSIPVNSINDYECTGREKLPLYGDGLNVRDWLHS